MPEIKSFIHAIEDELLDCDADIARIERLLLTLKQERQAGETFLAQHKSLLSPILTCPPDILLEIFYLSLEGSWPPFTRPYYHMLDPSTAPTPWILSSVCRQWRGILRESPSYWASFHVGCHRRPFLEAALQLSQHAPLQFSIDTLHSSICIPPLVEHGSRWQSVRFSGTKKTFAILDHLGHLPTLKNLALSLWADRDFDRDQYIVVDRSIDIASALSPFSDCPQLDELSILMNEDLLCDQNDLDTASLSIPWANLSKLTVSFGVHFGTGFRSLLSACTNLRQLTVNGMGKVNHRILPKPLLIHPNITSLTLEHFRLYLFQDTAYSALTHLSVAHTSPNKLIPFLSRYHHRVSHFEFPLEDVLPRQIPDNWDPVLVLLPDIIHLTVHLPIFPIPVWTKFSHSLTVRLPNLRTLTLNPHSSLLFFCQMWDIVPLLASRRLDGKLQVLEISCKRLNRRELILFPTMHTLDLDSPDVLGVARKIIEESAMMKALRAFKEKGLEVIINGKCQSSSSCIVRLSCSHTLFSVV